MESPAFTHSLCHRSSPMGLVLTWCLVWACPYDEGPRKALQQRPRSRSVSIFWPIGGPMTMIPLCITTPMTGHGSRPPRRGTTNSRKLLTGPSLVRCEGPVKLLPPTDSVPIGFPHPGGSIGHHHPLSPTRSSPPADCTASGAPGVPAQSPRPSPTRPDDNRPPSPMRPPPPVP